MKHLASSNKLHSMDVKQTQNVYCFNAAMSAREKGGAWLEAPDILEQMKWYSPKVKPNFITLDCLIIALDKADQREQFNCLLVY